MMNWEAIGAIGEILGALTVVLTLAYLATQVRQNSLGMKVSAKLEITRQFSDFADLLLKYPDIEDLNARGMSGEELNERDARQFSILLSKATWYLASMHFQFVKQSLSDDEWQQSMRLTKMYCSQPGYRDWWQSQRKNYSAEFVDYIESHWDETESA